MNPILFFKSEIVQQLILPPASSSTDQSTLQNKYYLINIQKKTLIATILKLFISNPAMLLHEVVQNAFSNGISSA